MTDKIGKALSILAAYAIAIMLFTLVLGEDNFITQRLNITNEVQTILQLGTLPTNAEAIVESDTYVNPEGTTGFIDQAKTFLSDILSAVVNSLSGVPIIGFITRILVLMLALLSLATKILTGSVVMLGAGLANESITDVMLGLLLLPASIAVLHAIILIAGWIISHIPVIGRGGD